LDAGSTRESPLLPAAGARVIGGESSSILRSALSLAFLAPVASCLAEALPADFPLRQGPLAFLHAADLARADLPAAELDRLSRFELIVTNGYEYPAPVVAEALRKAGCRVFRYFSGIAHINWASVVVWAK
jgi:hypothetical protein